MTISHHAGAPRRWAVRSEKMSDGLTRRGFLLGAGAALATVGTPPGLARTDLRAGVTAVPPPPTPPPLPPRRVAPTLIGYGLVNAWHRVDPDGFAALLAANGTAHSPAGEWGPAEPRGVRASLSCHATFEKG